MPRKPVLVPDRDPIVREGGLVESAWSKFFAALTQEQATSALLQGRTALTTQAAAISATSIPIQTVYTAEYRVSYYARVTQAATTSSTLQIAIGWTEGGVALSQSGTSLTGNTTTTGENATLFIVADGNTPITYTVTYASSGATPMQYRLTVVAERIG